MWASGWAPARPAAAARPRGAAPRHLIVPPERPVAPPSPAARCVPPKRSPMATTTLHGAEDSQSRERGDCCGAS